MIVQQTCMFYLTYIIDGKAKEVKRRARIRHATSAVKDDLKLDMFFKTGINI